MGTTEIHIYTVYDIEECGIEDPMKADLEEHEGEIVGTSNSHYLAVRDWISTNSSSFDTYADGGLLVVSDRDKSRQVFQFEYKCEPEITIEKVEE